MTAPLMPKATAVWLVENTALTFRQIATFCELHELEIQAIADGDVAYNIIGISPIANGQLTAEEIKRCEEDASKNLVANVMERNVKEQNSKNKKVLSPSQRNDKPAAILWLIKNCPELADSQIRKLVGTTNPTIAAIKNGNHKDMANLRAKNPVAIGLCSEKDLEVAINTVKIKAEKAMLKLEKASKTKKKKTTTRKKAVTKKKAETRKKAVDKKKTATKKKTVSKKKTTTKTAKK